MEQKTSQEKIPFPKEKSESQTPGQKTGQQESPSKEMNQEGHKK
ncbi:MAG TPA: hypothetical protein VF285_04895 [Castellaniella sp.]